MGVEILDFHVGMFRLSGIVSCLVCGGMVGFERQFSGKPAGIRTSVLICFSAYIFATLSSFLNEDAGDPSRVLGQIVTGVGFLGAGVMFMKKGTVNGVTSAAVIWLLAALGCLIAFGFETEALFFTVLTVILLVGVSFLEVLVKKLKSGVHDDSEE